jgi:NADPH:quinone reductase-like Zn-dependent oxidoreductase
MRAVVIRAHGGLEALEIVDRPAPAIKPDEALVAIEASGVNHLDVWVRKGVPGHAFPLPMVPGCDGAGVVREVGSLVQNVKAGDRVAIAPGFGCGACAACASGQDNLCRSFGIIGETRDGTAAELCAVPARNLLPLPDSIPFTKAAAVPLVYLTAWHMLVDRCRIQPGDDVLVHAAGSGVSVAAIQIARLFQARVLTTASSDEKLAKARKLGADVVINYAREDVLAAVRAATGKAGVDIVVDHVGEATFETSLRCLKKGGRVVTCGATSGPKLSANLRLIFFKSLSILGSTMGSLGELHRIWKLFAAGSLDPVIDRVLPLDRVAEAHRALEERTAFGKVILEVKRGSV